jgi:peptide/nickel transport system substrate-binding protein
LSDDGYTWTYDLREGVFHHNTDSWTGTEFTASDVVFSRATLDKGEEDSHAPSGIWDKIIHEFDDSNPHQLKWTTAVVELDMYYLAGIEERGLIYSKDYWDAVGRDAFVAHPVATGPWKFKEFVVNEHITYERNEEHWRKVPDFAELQLLYVTEDATRLAQLLAGEVHIIGIPGVLIPEAEAGGMGIGYSTRPGNADFIVIGGNYPEDHPKYDATDPLVNVDVRKALSMAIDRKLLKDTFFGDRASYMPAPLCMAGRDPMNSEWPVPYTYDPDAAKALLAGAGYPDGFDMTLMCFKAESAVPEHEDMGEAVADMWEQIGVNVTFTPKERLHINAQGYDFGMGRHAWIATVVAGWTVSSQWPWVTDYPKGNAYYFYDAYLDEIFPDLKAAVNLEQRDPVVLKYGNRMMTNFDRLPLFWLHPAVAFDPAVVVDYSVNMSAFGPTMWHEYTEVVLK